MSNPLNLAKHEIAELLADADEAASFFAGFDPAVEDGDETAVHIVDAHGNIFQVEPETLARWEKAIRTLSGMVEVP